MHNHIHLCFQARMSDESQLAHTPDCIVKLQKKGEMREIRCCRSWTSLPLSKLPAAPSLIALPCTPATTQSSTRLPLILSPTASQSPPPNMLTYNSMANQALRFFSIPSSRDFSTVSLLKMEASRMIPMISISLLPFSRPLYALTDRPCNSSQTSCIVLVSGLWTSTIVNGMKPDYSLAALVLVSSCRVALVHVTTPGGLAISQRHL